MAEIKTSSSDGSISVRWLMPASIWQIDHPLGASLLTGLALTGWLLAFCTTLLIDHFDFFGMRQVTLYLRRTEYTPKEFMTPSLYKYMRNPLYLAFIVFFWATPRMTAGHLLFAVVMTAYIFVAIRWEERDLVRLLGDPYRRYRETTPMILPWPRKR